MFITIEINKCKECRHFTNLEQFKKNICEHPNVPSHKGTLNKKLKKIPNWCPLKNGYSYE